MGFSRLQFIKLQLRTFLKVNELIRLTIKIKIAKLLGSKPIKVKLVTLTQVVKVAQENH